MSSPTEKANIEYQIQDCNECLEGHAQALNGKAHLDNKLEPHEIEYIKRRLGQLTDKLREINNSIP
jgi:hypothetical protein